MDDNELIKLSAGELTDLGICPTCFNRKHNGAIIFSLSHDIALRNEAVQISWNREKNMCMTKRNLKK